MPLSTFNNAMFSATTGNKIGDLFSCSLVWVRELYPVLQYCACGKHRVSYRTICSSQLFPRAAVACVTYRLSLRLPGPDPRSGHVGFVTNQIALRQLSLWDLLWFLASFHHCLFSSVRQDAPACLLQLHVVPMWWTGPWSQPAPCNTGTGSLYRA